MVTREQVRTALRGGTDYEAAGRELDVPPGLAYLVMTGFAADGSDSMSPEDRHRPGMLPTSQQLVGPAPENPTTKEAVHAWVRARARQDPQMRVAAQRRTAEPGTPPLPEDDTDIVDVVARQHQETDALVKRLKTIPGHRKGGSQEQLSRRESVVDMVTVALSRHEAAEQEVLWPAVRRTLPDGDARADQALGQEQEGKDVLAALGAADPDSDEFDDLVERLVSAVRKHVAFEDAVLLDLSRSLDDDTRADLGRAFRRAHAAAPTRPHPHAPKTMPGVAVAGTAAAAADRVRDAVGDRPAERRGKAGRRSP